jgi:hypothetical protein
MTIDWFRKKTWTAADEQDFEAHLKRSRGTYYKSQYLRIQAGHLQNTSPPLYAQALLLLDRVLNEHRDDSQVAAALLQKAQCFDAIIGFDAALAVFREGLAFERSHLGWRTNAWIVFPWRIIKECRIDLYDEAIDAVSYGSSSGVAFPIEQYRMCVVLAVIKNEKGEHMLARSLAKDAYEAAARTHSDFRYHKSLGLVAGVEPWVKSKLDQILTA